MDPNKFDKQLRKTLEEKEIRAFRSAAQEAMEAYKKKTAPPPPRIRPLYRGLLIAASLGLLIGLTILWRFAKTEAIDAKQLALEYLQSADPDIAPFEEAFRDRTPGSAMAQPWIAFLWQDFDSLYRAGDYTTALQAIGQIREADPEFLIASRRGLTFYEGLCLLRLEQPRQALALLETVEPPFLEKATFFRALALIQLDRPEEAKALLQTFLSTENPYSEAANRLCKALEK
jgi:tetratricopeptide (TPR) repeat protein